MKKYAASMVFVMGLLVAFGALQVTSYGFQKAKGKGRGKLSATLSKLDLSEEQKTKISDVQAKYKEQIDALNQQLKDLKAKQAAEELEVLTPDQKKKYEELEEAAKKEKAEKAEKAKAERARKKAEGK